MRNKGYDVDGFIGELEKLSEKYGIWIEVIRKSDAKLVDGVSYESITDCFYPVLKSRKYAAY